MLTQSQREERRTGIGGSDAAVVAGISKYKTPYQLYLEKTGFGAEEILESNGDNDDRDPIYFGNALEDFVAQEYQRRTHKIIYHCNGVMRHAEYPWMLANPDRFISDSTGNTKLKVLECKTSNEYKLKEWGKSWTDEYPTEYLLQTAHYRIVTGAEYVDLAVLIGGQIFRIYRYKENKKLEDNLIALEANFWNNHVLKEIPPDIQTEEDAKLRWAVNEGEALTANDDICEKIKKYHAIDAEIEQLECMKLDLRLDIMTDMKTAARIVNHNGKSMVNWLNEKRTSLDNSSLKKDQPEIYKNYLKTKQTRVLRIMKGAI